MNKKLSIWLGVGVLAVLAVIALSYPGQENKKESDKSAALSDVVNLRSPETSFDFGEISMAAGKVSRDFEVENDSSSTVVLDKLFTSCMCTNAYFVSVDGEFGPFGMPGHGFVPGLDRELKSGGKAVIRVIFDPAAHGPAGVGPVGRSIFLESGGNVKRFDIEAVVRP
jgi:hypothetical protein